MLGSKMALKVSVKTYYIKCTSSTECLQLCINADCKGPDQLHRQPRILRDCQFERSGSAVKEAECDMRDEEADRT